MRFKYVIIIVLTLSSILTSLASELPKLTFATKNTYKYFQIKRKDTDGSYINVGISRALKEFEVGKKYCFWNSSSWGDVCQDVENMLLA